jgi:acetyl esterase
MTSRRRDREGRRARVLSSPLAAGLRLAAGGAAAGAAAGRVASAELEAAVFRGLMGLPAPVVRRLAGPPVVLDGQQLDAETQWMLRLQRLMREPGPETLPIPQGRAAMRRQTRLVGGRQPVSAVRDLTVPGAAGPLGARLYVPGEKVAADTGPASEANAATPLLVLLHGGGMIYGDLDTHDAPCRLLAERTGSRVLAVDYRLAPEHRFPAGVEDCWTAYQWAVEHAEELGADPERIGVGGDSAGGYLSAAVALRAAGAGVPCAVQLLVYPMTNMAEPSRSRELFGRGFYLTSEFLALANESDLVDPAEARDPQVSVAFTEKIPDGLAPALVYTAGFDPLRDEGEAWARRLADHGVEVHLRRFPGLIHGFFNLVGAGRSSRAAVAEIAGDLREALHRSR